MMKKRNILRTLFLLLAITATFLAFSTMLEDKPVAADSARKESLDGCPKQQKGGKMIWENLSHQFFSTI